MGRARTDEAFQTQLLNAKRIMKNEATKQFPPETVTSSKRTTISMTKTYDFLTAADLEKKFGCKVNIDALHLPVMELPDEFNKVQKGIILARDEPRKLSITNAHDIQTETGLMLPASQLREGQGLEVQRSYEARATVARNIAVVSGAELQDGFEKFSRAQAAAAEMGAPPAPLQMAMQASQEKVSEQEEIEEDAEVKAARRLAQASTEESQKARRGKSASGRGGKGGGGGGGRGGKRAQQLPGSEAQAPKAARITASSMSSVVKKEEPESSGDERSRSPARKSVSGKSAMSNHGDHEGKCKEMIERLSVLKALSGLKIKNDLYQARRLLQTAGETPGVVELRARYDLVTKPACSAPATSAGYHQRKE